MQAGAVRSAKATVAFIPTSATGLIPLSRRGVKTVCMQPQRVAVHLTAALSLITKAGPCSKLAEVKRRHATEEHDVNYSHSSGVEKYPCEFWPALLLFCMMLCFEVKKKKMHRNPRYVGILYPRRCSSPSPSLSLSPNVCHF